jgi:hypothetical protein
VIVPTTAANRRRSGLLVFTIMCVDRRAIVISGFIIEIDKNKKIGNTVDYKNV